MKPYLLLLAIAAAPTMLCAQDWSLLGNAGTNPSTNFIGTIDNVALHFRVNNQAYGRLEPGSNIFLGALAGQASGSGNNNTGVGSLALYANTSGFSNTAIGNSAMYVNTSGSVNTALGNSALVLNSDGGGNCAVGSEAMWSNDIGDYNTAMGYQALRGNRAGNYATAIGAKAMYYANNITTAFTNRNVAVGYEALRGSTTASANTGNGNTALGYQPLLANTSGSNNLACGEAALGTNTTGINNTATGYKSLRLSTTGSGNTGCGYYALSSNTTGSNNTGIGRSSNVSSSGLTNATALGYTASVNASNKVRLGNSSVTVVEGQVPYTNPSDARFKRQVQEDVKGLDFILQLRPVSYAFDRLAFAKHVNEEVEGRESELAAQSTQRTVGFLAQEVEKSIGTTGFTAFDAVHVPENAQDNYGLAYAQFVVPLVKAVQELHEANKELKEENARIREELHELWGRSGGAPPASLPEEHAGDLAVYPQPASGVVHVVVPTALVGLGGTIGITDAKGSIALVQEAAALPAVITLELPSTLREGLYLLSLRTQGQEQRSARMILKR
ncbi:MAG: tail fiber domain-containing protein [Flavobacteriales bacterium]